jgi:hypothetical protein
MIALEGALMGYNVKCLPKIMYKLKHSNLNETEICSLQKKVNAKMKSKLNVSKTILDMLLHGHRLGDGAEFPHLWDVTNMETQIILQNSLTKTNKDMYPIIVGAFYRLQKWTGVSPEIMHSPKLKMIKQDGTAWLSALWM